MKNILTDHSLHLLDTVILNMVFGLQQVELGTISLIREAYSFFFFPVQFECFLLCTHSILLCADLFYFMIFSIKPAPVECQPSCESL